MAPAEAHDQIDLVERSHAFLRAVYETWTVDLAYFSREERLSTPFMATNDAPGRRTGIARTAIVFGGYLKFFGAGSGETMLERANIVRQGTETVTKKKGREVIRHEGRARRPSSKAEAHRLALLPPGQSVLSYREDV